MTDTNTLVVEYLIEDHRRLAAGGQQKEQIQQMLELVAQYRKEAAQLRADLMEAQNGVGDLTRSVKVEREHRHSAEQRVKALQTAVDDLKKNRTPNQQVADKTRTLEAKLATAVKERDELRQAVPVSSTERADLKRLIGLAVEKYGDGDEEGVMQTLDRALITLEQREEVAA